MINHHRLSDKWYSKQNKNDIPLINFICSKSIKSWHDLLRVKMVT